MQEEEKKCQTQICVWKPTVEERTKKKKKNHKQDKQIQNDLNVE